MKELKKGLMFIVCLLMTSTLLFTKTANLQAKTVKLKSIKLNKSIYTLKRNKTVKLKATFNPKKTTQKKLIWSSSNKKIATVDQKGKVKAKKNGKATIIVKVKGTNKKAKCKIYVGLPVSKVVLNTTTKTLSEGEKYQLKATLSPAKATVKGVVFTTSDKNVATVSKTGLVSAIKAGTCQITAMSKDGTGKKAIATITVKKQTTKGSSNTQKDRTTENTKQSTETQTTTETKPDTKDLTQEEKINEVKFEPYEGEKRCLGCAYDEKEILSGTVNLEIIGTTEELPEDWIQFPLGATYEIKDDSKHKYEKIITVTGKSGFRCVYNVTYYPVNITSVKMIKNGADTILNWNYDYEEGSFGEIYHEIKIDGLSEDITSDLEITCNRDDAVFQIVDSELSTYSKKLLITIGAVTGKYYIYYNNVVLTGYYDLFSEEESDTISEEELDNIRIKRASVKKDDGRINELRVYGSEREITQEILDKLNLTFYVKTNAGEKINAEAKVVDSDRTDYQKMVQINCQNEILRYYLQFSLDDKYFTLSSIKALKNEENQIINWRARKNNNYPIGENDSIMTIRGYAAVFPDDTTVTAKYEDAIAELKNSDIKDFSKMIVVTYKGESRKFYIHYICIDD